jgi:hypothetical protein
VLKLNIAHASVGAIRLAEVPHRLPLLDSSGIRQATAA